MPDEEGIERWRGMNDWDRREDIQRVRTLLSFGERVNWIWTFVDLLYNS